MHIQTMAGMHVAALEVAVLVDNVYSSIADLSFMWFTRHADARWLTGWSARQGFVTAPSWRWRTTGWCRR
jgi:hypothetical protein